MAGQSPDVTRMDGTVKAHPAIALGIGKEITHFESLAAELVDGNAAVRAPRGLFGHPQDDLIGGLRARRKHDGIQRSVRDGLSRYRDSAVHADRRGARYGRRWRRPREL